jgi:hypothetical protein
VQLTLVYGTGIGAAAGCVDGVRPEIVGEFFGEKWEDRVSITGRMREGIDMIRGVPIS